ncbi:MAG: molybdopterin-dependent oxidoreductase, partial [Bacillota bacterium]|nr:molybdopterin-dependent oxidoreductase [Bacillota bacterium]
YGVLRNLDRRFFNAFGGATNYSGSMCWSSGYRAQEYDFGRVESSDWSDLLEAKTIILWGRDPAVTSIHMVPYLRGAQEKGAKIIVINPLRVKSVNFCDEYISVKPGTDGALALGIAYTILNERWLDLEFVRQHVEGFEEYAHLVRQYPPAKVSKITGIDKEQIYQLAKAIAKEKPASLVIGYGLQRYTNGGKTVRGIDSLMAITGNIGKAGACAHYAQGVNSQLLNKLSGESLAQVRRSYPVSAIAEKLTKAEDPSIKAIFVTRSNPVSQLPHTTKVLEAFNRVDFVAVVDFFFNDTAARANLVLPCTTVFEDIDLISTCWNNYLTLAEPVLAPKGEAKPDWQIFCELALKLQLDNFWPQRFEELKEQLQQIAGTGVIKTEKTGYQVWRSSLWEQVAYEWLKEALDSEAAVAAQLSIESLKQGPQRNPLAPQMAWQALDFATPSGKYELFSKMAEVETGYGLPEYVEIAEGDSNPLVAGEYPYFFLTPHPVKQMHSQFADDKDLNWPQVLLHPETAKLLYLANMDKVIVESPRGQLTGLVQINQNIRQDTVVIEEGTWIKNGGGVNFLTSDLIADMGEGTPYYDCRCTVKKIVDHIS